MRVFVFAAVLASFGAPVSSSFAVGQPVPRPAAIKVSGLPPVLTLTGNQAPRQAAKPSVVGGASTGVSDQIVRVDGRRLLLGLMRSEGGGVAVLSVPEGGLVPSLPQISGSAFRALAALHSRCRAEGPVQTLQGRDGPVALTTGLDCTGSES